MAVLSVVAGLSAFVSVFAYAGLARRAWTAFLPIVGAVLEVGLIVGLHATAQQIALCSGVALLVTLAIMAVVEGRVWAQGVGVDAAAPSQ